MNTPIVQCSIITGMIRAYAFPQTSPLNPPNEILDIIVGRMQSADIELVEWGTLLYRWLHVPHVHVVSCKAVHESFGRSPKIEKD